MADCRTLHCLEQSFNQLLIRFIQFSTSLSPHHYRLSTSSKFLKHNNTRQNTTLATTRNFHFFNLTLFV